MHDDDREMAMALARDYALAHSGDHSYLPTTEEEAKSFEPHEWAVQAIIHALGTRVF